MAEQNQGGFFSGAMSPDETELLLDKELRGERGLLGSFLAKQGIGRGTDVIQGDFQNDPRMMKAVKMQALQKSVSQAAQEMGIDAANHPIEFSKLVFAKATDMGMPDIAMKASKQIQDFTTQNTESAAKQTTAEAAKTNASSTADFKAAQSAWLADRAQLYGALNDIKREHYKAQDEAAMLRAQLAGVKATTVKADLVTMSPKNISTMLKTDEDLKDMSKSDREGMAVNVALRARQLYGKDNNTDVNTIIDQAIQEEKDRGLKPGKEGWLGGYVPFTGTNPSYTRKGAAVSNTATSTAPDLGSQRVTVVDSKGNQFTVPAAQLDMAKKKGYKVKQ